MTHNYNAKVNYFEFLSGKPLGWELLFPESTLISGGDTINVIEVDAGGTPTGNTMTGTVWFAKCNDFWLYSDKSNLVYIIPD